MLIHIWITPESVITISVIEIKIYLIFCICKFSLDFRSYSLLSTHENVDLLNVTVISKKTKKNRNFRFTFDIDRWNMQATLWDSWANGLTFVSRKMRFMGGNVRICVFCYINTVKPKWLNRINWMNRKICQVRNFLFFIFALSTPKLSLNRSKTASPLRFGLTVLYCICINKKISIHFK